ncbi:efflux RND transporter periplasmic adaptor subunit [Algivirga pacifica]|uniref:Membrane fusion protein, Cu(I)/Ag(I) efflux system n=1 Tax=Algivirga pacifica TaxID=1162670 RepID=A0ABP9DAB6_9BACT
MKKIQTITVTAVVTLSLGILLGWVIFGIQETPRETPHIEKYSTETMWTCSMHPQIRQPEEGDCPICGMDLIPLKDEIDKGDPLAVKMSPTAMKLANIQTDLVGRMHPVKEVNLHGKVQVDERRVYSQTSHIKGRIEKLMINFTGEYVKKYQPIAQIYSPELITAQQELFEARKIMDTQPMLFNAAKEKLKNWKLTEAQIERILQKGTPDESFPVLSDHAGYVTAKMVNSGDHVMEGAVLFQVADLSKVWVLLDIYESDLPWVNKGDKVQIRVSSLPGKLFEGVIDYIDPVINPQTRVAKARLVINNPTLQLKPEMFVSAVVEATLKQTKDALVIPKSAVMWTGERSVVYVKTEEKQGVYFRMREIELGTALGDSYILKDGLSEGEEIATHGTFSIDAAAQLAGKPSMMSGEKNTLDNIKVIAITSKAKATFKPLYTAYFELKEQLAADDFLKAKMAGLSLKEALNKVNTNALDLKAQKVWGKIKQDMEKPLQYVSDHENIESLRKDFEVISEVMLQLTVTFQPLDHTIYQQYCPMAFDNKGAIWLSLEEEVKNPYFGEMMLRCGEVQHVIKR